MPSLPGPDVLAAAQRLRGHLVLTPLIGGAPAALPGPVDVSAPVDVRWKVDFLQPGGSGWYRGFLHLLLRSFGSLPGLSFAGPARRSLAAATAARQQRLPFSALLGAEPPEPIAAALRELGGRLEVVADPAAAAARLQRHAGHVPLPGAEHPEVAAGLATAGLELALALPTGCAAVYADAEVAPAIEAGIAAAGRTIQVLPVRAGEGDRQVGRRLIAGAAVGHGLLLGEEAAAILAAALHHPGGGTVGVLLLE